MLLFDFASFFRAAACSNTHDHTAKGNMIRIALVEDTADIRNSLHIMIGGSPGFECVAACASGEEALGAVPALQPDIVVMDIELPGISGIDCMRRLRESGFRGQFMMLTIFMDDANIFNALEAGANGYILKNTPPAKLIEALSELHAGGAPMTSQIARRVLQSFHPVSTTSPNDSESLTKREEEILQMLAAGLRYKAIAEKLFISPATVRTHIHSVYTKLHVGSRGEAVAKMRG
jgi:DNA-binding NarL/FixJ family response regulator